MNSILPNTEYSVTQSQFLQIRSYHLPAPYLPKHYEWLRENGKKETWLFVWN